jgi:hypothetical protein
MCRQENSRLLSWQAVFFNNRALLAVIPVTAGFWTRSAGFAKLGERAAARPPALPKRLPHIGLPDQNSG